MRFWNIALIGALMIGALIVTVAHDRSRFAAQRFALSDAHAASGETSRTARDDDRLPPVTLSEADYGWGPFRTVDW